jgi:hypothetical protein
MRIFRFEDDVQWICLQCGLRRQRAAARALREPPDGDAAGPRPVSP